MTLINPNQDRPADFQANRRIAGRSVVVQVVLYNDRYQRTLRTLQSILSSILRAQDLESVSEAAILIGDSSNSPCLAEDEVDSLSKIADQVGVEFGYRFFGQNLGSAGGSNRLAQHAESDLIFVLNPDTYLHPDALHMLVTSMQCDVGIAEARQLPIEHPKAYDLVTGETSWASGACMLINREAFNTVGGFDTEHFFLHCDDVDFSWRLRIAGWRIQHIPRAIVFHDKRVDAEGRLRPPAAERYYGILGRLMLCRRYGAEDVLDRTVAAINDRRDPTQLRALEEFRRRENRGQTPSTIAKPQLGSVPEFVDGNYARHRF